MRFDYIFARRNHAEKKRVQAHQARGRRPRGQGEGRRILGPGPGGLRVRVHATGRKVYVVQSRGPRGPVRVTLGRHGALSCDEARKRAAPVIDRIRRGEEPLSGEAEPAPTVADLAGRFMREYVASRCKPSTAPKYRSVLDNHILPALGSMNLGDVGKAEAAALQHALRATLGRRTRR